jgi:hypothetical protein
MTEVDERRIKERIQTLRAEIAEIRRASSLHVRQGRHSAQDFRDHDKRMFRLKQLLDELARLRNRKRETE